MKFSQASSGRVFILRLEDGEVILKVIEQFAAEHHVTAASVIVVGGADSGSKLVVGPEDGRGETLQPMTKILNDVHEVSGSGTLFCDEAGTPILHMHMACGRNDDTITGCIRTGVKVWQVLEVIIHEIVDSSAKRVLEQPLGLKLLSP